MCEEEPAITINGASLTPGQAMTMRIAITHYASCLAEHGLGTDAVGMSLNASYIERAQEIEELMLAHTIA
jgi:hypothetical protein